MIIGYTTGVYDLFHIGHLNLLKNAKGMCDRLIVGVARDEIVTYKPRKVIIPFEERIEIVRSIKYVDLALQVRDVEEITLRHYFYRRRLVRRETLAGLGRKIQTRRRQADLFPLHKGHQLHADKSNFERFKRKEISVKNFPFRVGGDFFV